MYEGVVMQEELEQAVRAGENNLLPHVRRLHLVVTALREFYVAFEICLKREQSLLDASHLFHIRGLSCFFVKRTCFFSFTSFVLEIVCVSGYTNCHLIFLLWLVRKCTAIHTS